jgi:hypothetical protein
MSRHELPPKPPRIIDRWLSPIATALAVGIWFLALAVLRSCA